MGELGELIEFCQNVRLKHPLNEVTKSLPHLSNSQMTLGTRDANLRMS